MTEVDPEYGLPVEVIEEVKTELAEAELLGLHRHANDIDLLLWYRKLYYLKFSMVISRVLYFRSLHPEMFDKLFSKEDQAKLEECNSLGWLWPKNINTLPR